MKYFFDTEFIERPGYLKLVSLGVVAEDDRTFYAVSTDFDPTQAGPWVREHVLPKLPPRHIKTWMSEAFMAHRLKAFVGNDPWPEFWAYFAAYDWVLFTWLFGSMLTMPKRWPMCPMDLRQSMLDRGFPKDKLPPKPADAHDALADARWLQAAHAAVFAKPEKSESLLRASTWPEVYSVLDPGDVVDVIGGVMHVNGKATSIELPMVVPFPPASPHPPGPSKPASPRKSAR